MEIGKLVQRLAIEIAVDEGLRDYWYIDTEGHETIGIGFTKNAFVGLSEDAYRIILMTIIQERLIRMHTMKEFKWFPKLPMTAQAVVFNMVYQMGIVGFLKFKKTINHLKHKRWELASKEMLKSKWARQTPKRAQKMSEWIASCAKAQFDEIIKPKRQITDKRGNMLFDADKDELSAVATIPLIKK